METLENLAVGSGFNGPDEIFCGDTIVANCSMVNLTPQDRIDFAAELVRRYNNFAAQSKLLERIFDRLEAWRDSALIAAKNLPDSEAAPFVNLAKNYDDLINLGK